VLLPLNQLKLYDHYAQYLQAKALGKYQNTKFNIPSESSASGVRNTKKQPTYLLAKKVSSKVTIAKMWLSESNKLNRKKG